jgi:hypothetical protein
MEADAVKGLPLMNTDNTDRKKRDESLAAIIAFCWAKQPELISASLDWAEQRRTERAS